MTTFTCDLLSKMPRYVDPVAFLDVCLSPQIQKEIRICVYLHPSNIINKCSHYNHLCPVAWLHMATVWHMVFLKLADNQQQMPICEAHLSQNGQKTEPLRTAPQPHRRRSFDKQHQGARFDLLHLPICYDSILYYISTIL